MKTLEQLAEEAGVFYAACGDVEGTFALDKGTHEALSRFRAACRAEALEEAARACIALGKEHPAHINSPVQLVAKWCAAAIREMK